MRVLPSAISVVAGMFAGVALVLSCGDNSPNNADAATCDCPAAEPPLASRTMVLSNTRVIEANGRGGTDTGCPEGSLRLEGSCTTDSLNPVRDVTLEQSGFYQEGSGVDPRRGWSCWFKNNEATPVTIRVSVVCLMPAQ